jgi:hypothetical protein
MFSTVTSYCTWIQALNNLYVEVVCELLCNINERYAFDVLIGSIIMGLWHIMFLSQCFPVYYTPTDQTIVNAHKSRYLSSSVGAKCIMIASAAYYPGAARCYYNCCVKYSRLRQYNCLMLYTACRFVMETYLIAPRTCRYIHIMCVHDW